MQTFLPYPEFAASARVLDDRRLGRQRAEALTILRGHWEAHPCARMWRGHERSLALYALAIAAEWTRRGFKDTVGDKVAALMDDLPDTGPPWWLGDPRLHLGHQSALVRKLPSHYRQYFPDVADDIPYFWPASASRLGLAPPDNR